MKMAFILVVCSAITLYVVALGYIYFSQDDMIFPHQQTHQDVVLADEMIEPLTLKINNAVTLQGWLRKDEQSDAGLILYFGGNAEDTSYIFSRVKELEGYDILTFNYRGYGKSSGRPTEDALFVDALKIYDTYAKGRKVIVMGRSLGSGVATYLASQRVVDGLILVTPYDSIASMAKKMFPFFPIDLLLNHPFESTYYIGLVKSKIAVMEVANDTVIPRYHLEKLLEEMPTTPLHVTFKDTTHNDVLSHTSFTKTLQIILGKLSE